jgi:hypothetical protein
VTGSYSGPEGSGLRLTGTLSGERELRLISDDGAMEWMGAMEWRTDRDWGLSAAGVALRLRVTRGPTEGAVFDFHYADPY